MCDKKPNKTPNQHHAKIIANAFITFFRVRACSSQNRYFKKCEFHEFKINSFTLCLLLFYEAFLVLLHLTTENDFRKQNV